MSTVTEPAPAHALRPATRADLPAVLALLADEEQVVDPATVVVTGAYERAFVAIDRDPRNELLVLVDGGGTVVGCRSASLPAFTSSRGVIATSVEPSTGASSAGRSGSEPFTAASKTVAEARLTP